MTAPSMPTSAGMTPGIRPISVTESVRTTNLGDKALIEALRAYIPTVMRSRSCPGVNIALARRGEIVWEAGFGLADVAKQTPMTPTTVFRSGSMGKTYTGTAIMQLVERGVIGLHDPINKHLPFEVSNPLGGREVTVHDLLTHRSGLGTDAAVSLFEKPRSLREEVADQYAKASILMTGVEMPRWIAKPGYQMNYSNLGIATLGLIVELTNPDGLSFARWVDTHIMQPLGMTSAQYPIYQAEDQVRSDIWPRMSIGYAPMGRVWIPTATVYFGEYPAGAFVATPADHLKFVLAMAHQGSYNGSQVLKPDTVNDMLTPQDAGPGHVGFPGSRQGLIWMLFDPGTKLFRYEHGGAHMYGWYNTAVAWPEQGTAFVLALNSWPLPSVTTGLSMIQQFITRWVADEQSTVAVAAQTSKEWARKVSYLRGLLYIESFIAGIGTPTRLADQEIVRIAKASMADPESGVSWDADAFIAGARAMNGIDLPTNAGIQALVRSGRLEITLEEAELAWKELEPQTFAFASLGGLLKVP